MEKELILPVKRKASSISGDCWLPPGTVFISPLIHSLVDVKHAVLIQSFSDINDASLVRILGRLVGAMCSDQCDCSCRYKLHYSFTSHTAFPLLTYITGKGGAVVHW